MKDFSPKSGSEAEWNDAYSRLENYLCALRVVNPVQRRQIILRLLERAADKYAANPELCPMVLAMEQVRVTLDWWFEQILPSPERGTVTGLISLFAIDALEKWPTAFLAEEIPADFQHAMLECRAHAAPDLQVSSMVPQPFDNPLLTIIPLPDVLGKLMRSLTVQVTKGTVTEPSKSTRPADQSH